MTAARLTAFLCYRDPDALVEWISDVLGYDGQLVHAEVRRGDAVKGDCVGSGLGPECRQWSIGRYLPGQPD